MNLPAEGQQRVVIEGVLPQIDAGRFPIKRVVGETVIVEGDIFADGHDVVVAHLLFRHQDDATWSRIEMKPLGNDRWRAQFPVKKLGKYRYTLVGYIDHFKTWRRDLLKRLDAQQSIIVELQIGIQFVHGLSHQANAETRQHLQHWCQRIQSATPEAIRQLCQDAGINRLIDELWHPEFVTRFERELVVDVQRIRAAFSSWYELFPRSAGNSPGSHGTFRDVISRLPYVADMGFQVLYLPPIHPIGRQFRKGKNNAVNAEPDDVGSPWAIGSEEGGHKAILPELGNIQDFDELVKSARTHCIEIALDIAFQCAPDHPYVQEHPDWFTKRPDGSIQYAENPPKKYQDIYPLNFESPDWKNLWQELKSIFEFWIDHGVKIFRVDNPHTKAFAFWEWCLNTLLEKHPDLIFLSEAFTRPKLKYRLAKLGFTQSYTYFSWRHNKQELTEYLTELTKSELAEYFRPNFWPNTPDILTEELQTGGRAAFSRRVILAATLSSNYGVYGPPFEHQWSLAAKPGSEEYLHSEKYQQHHHDWKRPDSLSGLIARLNRIRRDQPALQRNQGLDFHQIDNDQLVCYSKCTCDRTTFLLMVVNLDNHYTQSGFVELPLANMGLLPDEPYQMHDLLTDSRYMWCGPRNYVELNPNHLPAHIFQIRRRIRSESGREYFQ